MAKHPRMMGLVSSIGSDLIASCHVFGELSGEPGSEPIILDCFLDGQKFNTLKLSEEHFQSLGGNSAFAEFQVQIPSTGIKEGQKIELLVRSRDHSVSFGTTIDGLADDLKLLGTVTSVIGGAVLGFAKNLRSEQRVVISIFDEQGLLTVGSTGSFACGEPPIPYSPADGFVIPLPIQWHRHPTQKLNVVFSNTNIHLSNSPVYVRLGMKVDNIRIRKSAIF